jgi:ABC-2 type transport system permease protein
VRLVVAHVRATTLELARYPSFSLSTLIFPTTLFLLFAARSGEPNQRLAGFAGIAVLGVAFFQFGVGIAADRVSAWETFMRTLPARPAVRLAGRVGSAALFASASAGCVVAAGVATSDVSLAGARWGLLAVVLLGGAVPFALLGIALGYLVRPRAALPVANLVYLPLAYAGGLWTGPAAAPGGPARLLPTHLWAELLWAAAGRRGPTVAPLAGLVVWTGVFAGLASWGYRRDEGERFR